MSKTSTRVLSMVLTVFMVISMLTVFAVASATPFAESYDGTVIPKTALLVDVTITEENEATVTRAWDGKEYTFVVGVNAFKSLTEAYEYAKANEIARPAIIITGWTAGENLTVEMASDVYAPNWNTAPMNEMTDDFNAVASNGADWTANTTYAANEMKIGDFIVNGDVNGSVSINGFTISKYIKHDNLRTTDAPKLETLIKNCKMKGESTNSNIVKGTGNKSTTSEDVITFKNFWLDTIGGTSTGASRFFGDNQWHTSHFVFDGLYVDMSKAEFKKANDHLKVYAANTSLTFKNSNLRNNAGTNTPYWNIAQMNNSAVTDYTKTLTFDNNVMYNWNNAGAIINNTAAASKGANVINITNNYVINTAASVKLFASANNATVTGNKLLGVAAQTYTGSTFANNFWVADAKATVDEYKAVAGAQYASQGTYFFDYNKEYSSAGITVTGASVKGTTEVNGSNIAVLIDGVSTEKLTAASFVTGETDKAVTKTLSDASGVVAEYDLATLTGVKELTLKVAYNDTYYNEYDVTVINTQIESFNTKLADSITINGVKFTAEDTAVYLPTGAKTYTEGENTVTYLKFAGETYKFVVDDENVFANAGADISALDGFTNIILTAGNYGNLDNLTFPATFYGSNFGINPNDKSTATAANYYDWGWNAAWDKVNCTVVNDIAIAATIGEGTLTFDGITHTKRLFDDRRTTDSERVDIVMKNVHVTNGNAAAGYLYLKNTRNNNGWNSGTGDADFGLTYADTITLKDMRVEGWNNFRMNPAEWVPANVVIDGLYYDYSKNGTAAYPDLGFVKGGGLTKSMSYTIKNCNLRGNGVAQANRPIGYFSSGYTPLKDGFTNALTLDNNIVYNYPTNSMAYIAAIYVPGYSSIKVINNTFITTDGTTSKLFAAQVKGTESSMLAAEGAIVIDNNSFLGNSAVINSSDDLGIGANKYYATNTFATDDYAAAIANPQTATGVYVSAMGENDYWLDYAKTVKASELVLAGAAAGTSDATVGTVAEETKSLVVTLGASKTTAGMVMTVGEKATGKLLNANKEEVAAATAAGTYYYRVASTTTPTVYVDYTVTVLGAPAQPFVSAYNVDGEGEVLNTAVLVDTSITEATGSVVEREWEGEYYKFTVGTNAFATFDAAYAAIADLSIDEPQIIVTNYSGNLVVKQLINIYAPNWNTTPMNEMGDMTKVGAKANGVDWTVNTKYTENEVSVGNIVFDGGFVCDEEEFVKVAGFTVTGKIYTDGDTATKRTPGSRINIELTNTKVNGTDILFDVHYTHGDDTSLAANDTLLVKNMHYAKSAVRFWNGDGAAPANTIIDGLYVDFDELTFIANTFIKSGAANSSFTIKNSNMRGTMTKTLAISQNRVFISTSPNYPGPEKFDENIGYSRVVTLDNNTFTHKTAEAQIYVEGPNSATEVTYTNNYFDMALHTSHGVIYARSGIKFGAALEGLNPDLKCVVTFTGNKVVNKVDDVKLVSTGVVGTLNLADNYIASAVAEDGNYANVPGCNGGVEGTTYYLDYAMTTKSDIIYDGYAVTDIGRNMIISKAATAEQEGEIIYAYDDKVVNNEGTITVNLAHIISGVDARNSATIYTADASADVETGTLTLTADANNQATLKLSVWSSDKTKAVTWNITLTEPTHNWGDWTKVSDATCQVLAVEKRVCQGDCMVADNCTAFETRDVGELSGHVYENYTVSSTATCEKAGTVTGKCKWCDATDTKDNAEDPIKAHVGKKVDAVAATCTTDGVKEYYTCENGCGKAYADADCKTVIADLAAWKVGDGKIAAGHKLTKVDAVAATCTVDGVKEYYTCSACNKAYADAEGKTEIADLAAWKAGDGKVAAGHVWGEYVYNNDATEEADGTKTAKCTKCDATDTVTAEGTKLAPSVEIKDTTKIFKDVKAGKWYTEAINYCYSYGFIAGTAADTFGRDTQVTRGMFITILARIAGVDTTTKGVNKIDTKFTDVKSGKYYVAAIKWANDNGIVKGTSDTTFGPDVAISRQDLCVMVVNYAKFMNFELTAKETEVTFTDASSIRKYAKDAVKVCQMADIVNGYTDGSFGPAKTASRAEAAVILFKLHSGFMK